MTLRLIDHLCTLHAQQAELRWPVAGDLAVLFDTCGSCDQLAASLHPEGVYSIRVLPDLDHRTYEHGDAIHEAAHAVLGLAADMPLNYAEIAARTDSMQAGPRSHTKWHDYETPIEQWAAMCWSGLRAHMRWLTELGLDTRANRVDVVNMGCHDTKLVLDAARTHGLPNDIGWTLSADLLERHWPTIERVADALLAAGRLSGDEIAALARVGVPS